MALNPERKAAWLAALRSGEYKQATGALRKGDAFCCLGVACDLWRQSPEAAEVEAAWLGDEISFREIGPDDYPVMRSVEDVLPRVVAEWLGADKDNGGEIPVDALTDGERLLCDRTLVELNDNDVPFSRIADLIEAHL